MMKEELQAILHELRRHFEAVYGKRLVKMALFGSQARGDAMPGSDIDVLVVLRGEVRPGEEIRRNGDITAALSLKYGAVISCTYISDTRYRTEQSPLVLNARREGIAV